MKGPVQTALLRCASFGSLQAAVVSAAEANEECVDGETPAHVAVRTSAPNAVVRLLVDKGADLKRKDSHGQTSLLLAVKCGASVDVIKTLAAESNVDDIDSLGRCALHFVAFAADPVETTKLLLDKHAACNISAADGRTPLHALAMAAGDKPESLERDAIIIAVFDKLVAAGCAIAARDSCGMTALHRAVGSGATRLVLPLLKRGADARAATTVRKATPLHFAAMRNDVVATRHLLVYGASVRAQALYGWTPLTCAEAFESSACAKLLTDAGALPESSERIVPVNERAAAMRMFASNNDAPIDRTSPTCVVA